MMMAPALPMLAADDMVLNSAAMPAAPAVTAGMPMGAALAGVLVEIAAVLPDRQPPRIPGYNGGPPSAEDLLAAYQNARAETGRQQGRQNRYAR